MIRIIESFVAVTDSGGEVHLFKIREQARESLSEEGNLPLPGKDRFELENGAEVTPIDENTFQLTSTGERLTRKTGHD